MKHVDHGYDLEVIGALQELANRTPLTRPIHFQPPGDYLLDGNRYHSRPEAACGYLLSEYCSGFQLLPGKTFQVPIGVGSGGDLQTVDFRHEEFFIEYHPPRIHQRYSEKGSRKCGGKSEPKEVRRLRGMIRKRNLPPHVRDRAYARLRAHLTRRYLQQRMRVLSASPIVEDFTLVVLSCPEELYLDFLEPFGGTTLPSLPKFLKDFKSLMKEAVDVRRG